MIVCWLRMLRPSKLFNISSIKCNDLANLPETAHWKRTRQVPNSRLRSRSWSNILMIYKSEARYQHSLGLMFSARSSDKQLRWPAGQLRFGSPNKSPPRGCASEATGCEKLNDENKPRLRNHLAVAKLKINLEPGLLVLQSFCNGMGTSSLNSRDGRALRFFSVSLGKGVVHEIHLPLRPSLHRRCWLGLLRYAHALKKRLVMYCTVPRVLTVPNDLYFIQTL